MKWSEASKYDWKKATLAFVDLKVLGWDIRKSQTSKGTLGLECSRKAKVKVLKIEMRTNKRNLGVSTFASVKVKSI